MRSNLNEKWLVCRICLKQPKEAMETIFNNDMDKDMTHMIYECGGVPIKQFDHYPDKICPNCARQLRVAFKFRVTCQRSHNHLSKFIAPVVVEKDEHITMEGSDLDLALEVDVEVTEAEEEVTDTNEDLEDVPTIALNVTDGEEIEVEEVAQLDTSQTDETDEHDVIKSEMVEEDLFVDVFEPMDDEAVEEFQKIERSMSAMSEPVEYLDDFVDEVYTSDDEYLPEPSKKRKRIVQVEDQKPQRIRQTSTMMKDMGGNKMKVNQSKKDMRKKRTKETSYICDICGNIYPSQGRLTEHIKLHKGIKPHECEICGHAFAQTQQLTRHMNTHTGNRPYKCNYCTAAFADLSTRNKHHRIHTNERPYVCDVCGKSFTYTNTLKFHKMIHTGEKPHVCDYCGKGFQQAYKLRNHKLTHEKKIGKVEKLEVEAVSNAYQEVNAATAQILEI